MRYLGDNQVSKDDSQLNNSTSSWKSSCCINYSHVPSMLKPSIDPMYYPYYNVVVNTSENIQFDLLNSISK
jgi:hypothetical protein